MIYPDYLPTQNAIDRDRASAQSGMRRAKADLDKMQAVRKVQRHVLQVEPNRNRETRTRNSNPI
jgi:hypothetical protein